MTIGGVSIKILVEVLIPKSKNLKIMDVKRLVINGKRKSLKLKANQVFSLHFPKLQKKKIYQVLRVLGAQKIRIPIVEEVPKETYLVLVVQIVKMQQVLQLRQIKAQKFQIPILEEVQKEIFLVLVV